MSLEDKIDALTAATNRLADLMEAGGGSPAAAADTTAKPKAAAAAKPKAAAAAKHTADEVKTAIVLVKDTVSEEAARDIIQKHAGAGKKLADLVALPAKFAAVIADCNAAVEGAGEEAEEEVEDENDGL